jgi:hypothetical protein
VYSVFCEFIENSNIVVSFHRTTAMKRRLGDDEIESQLKCKKCDVGLCNSQVLRGVLYKSVIQLKDEGGG